MWNASRQLRPSNNTKVDHISPPALHQNGIVRSDSGLGRGHRETQPGYGGKQANAYQPGFYDFQSPPYWPLPSTYTSQTPASWWQEEPNNYYASGKPTPKGQPSYWDQGQQTPQNQPFYWTQGQQHSQTLYRTAPQNQRTSRANRERYAPYPSQSYQPPARYGVSAYPLTQHQGPLPPLPHAFPFLPPMPPGFPPPPLPPYASSFDPTAPAYQPNASFRPEYMPQLQTNQDASSTSNFHFGLSPTAPYPLGQPSIFLSGGTPSTAEWQMAFSSLAVSKSSAAQRTPAPKPSPAYLQRAQRPAQREPTPRPLLVILDLNGTLLSRNPHNRRTFKSRPKVQEFLDYLFTNHHVMVWSSATPKNVRDMCSKLLTPEQNAQLVACWGRDKLRLSQADYAEKVQVYKQLSWVWEDETIRAKNPDANKDNQWSQANTVLIDDSALKGVSEPFNLVQLEEFTAAAGQMGTDVLVHVARYLEVLRVQRDVSAYIRCWPFVYDARENFDWEGLVEEEH